MRKAWNQTPSKSIAIRNIPPPVNVLALQTFLNLANYYRNIIPNMNVLRAALDKLLKKNFKSYWTTECEGTFEKIKTILTADLSLMHYDPSKDIIVASDALMWA